MKQEPFFLLTGIAALCILLTILVIIFDANSHSLQATLNVQQSQIQSGEMVQRTVENALVDMAKASLKDDKIKQLLLDNGYHVNVKPNPTPAQ